MRKLLAVLMLLALPLQFSWAVAASYCQHEEGQAVQHFGHHHHQHQQVSADGKEAGGKSPLQAHADCSACHLSCPAAAASSAAVSVVAPASLVAGDPPGALPSVVPESPERPKWMRFA